MKNLKKLALTVLLIQVVSTAYADDSFEFVKEGDKFIIKADNCKTIKEQISKLSEWSEWSGRGACAQAKGAPWYKFSDDCKADVTTCLPEHVKKYHGIHPDLSGPNCWNLSLVMSDLLPHLRYSSPEEMNFFMAPPLCRALNNGEERRPGDVGAIRTGRGEEVHGFIYVSDEMSYSKNGFSNQSPYELQTLNKVYEVYGIDDADPKCLANQMASSCSVGVDYFRCSSMKEYLEEVAKEEPQKKTQQVIPYIDNLDCLASNMAFDRTTLLNETVMKTFTDTVDALNAYVGQELKGRTPASLDDVDQFILASTQVRLNSILDQLQVAYQYSGTRDERANTQVLGVLVRSSQEKLNEITK